MIRESAITVEVEAFAGLNLNQETNSAAGREEQLYRASAYSLIGSLLRKAPDQAMLDRLSGLESADQKDGDDLLISMSTLALSSQQHNTADIEQEFHDLFIGLGKGEVVPYGSWYLTGFLMEKPLSDLRDDLIRLGFERNADIVEPEDHVAALCEVMSIMITESGDLKVQQKFFETHMSNWFESFFNDLSEAQSAVFYSAVERFGSAFIAFEKQYFSMAV